MTRAARISALTALTWLAACGGEPQHDGPQNGLLITIDTARQDAFGCYGGNPAVTPVMDAFAAESVIYDAARATAPVTLVSHASILTGLYPPRNTVRDNAQGLLPPEARTLAELASERGLRTAAIVATPVLASQFGVAQGFERYDAPEDDEEGLGMLGDRMADSIVDRALRFFDERAEDERFFLWIHFYDPHWPYEPPPAFAAQAGGNDYHGEVAFVDAELGRLFERMRAEGLFDDTLIAIAADHGESLGDHGEGTHSAMIYDPAIKVPFLVRHPDGHRAGEHSGEPVSTTDLFPTYVEALGLGSPGSIDGMSLFRRTIPEDRGVYFESYYGHIYYRWSALAGWADGRRKYMHSSEPELYDYLADPAEARNLLKEGEDATALIEGMREVFDREALPQATAQVDESTLQKLAGLGYAGVATGAVELPNPLDAEGLSPHRSAVELDHLINGIVLAEDGKLDEALVRWNKALELNPDNADVLQRAGDKLTRAQRYDEALPPLERLVQLEVPWPKPRTDLALCYVMLGRRDDAIALLEETVELAPSFERTYVMLGNMLSAAGDEAKAAEYRMLLAELRGE